MALNKRGIRRLADALVANKKRYNQDTWGEKEECGTFCCLAGFCYLEEVGLRKFNAAVKSADDSLSENCVKAGKTQLGIRSANPAIFSSVNYWPDDLAGEYYENGPRGRVIVALKALQRLLPSGRIDKNPKAAHTRLPQLKALLAKPGRKA